MVHDMINDASYMAHGYCLLWKPWLVAIHAGSDLFIFLAYFAIPVAIWIFLRKRPDLELKPLAVLFAAFIFLCGLTHVIQMITLWWPIYETQGLVKVATAAVSVLTAIMIFPLIPTAVAIPSPRALQAANAGLVREVEAHQDTLERLRDARNELERRVAQRTQQLEHSKARLEALITASAQIVWTTDSDGLVDEDSPSWRAFTGQTYEEWRGNGWLNAIHPEDRANTLAAWREAVQSRTQYNVEYRLKHVSGEARWTNARGVPLVDEEGAVSEWVGMNEDITARKRSEEHANLIMRELSHRTKNLLAVIASLARRTFDGDGNPKAQAEDLVDRIHGLARSHDLLVRADWRGVSLGDLVATHLELFGFDPDRITIDGPPIQLKPEVAQSIGLALHELATNASKHGALKKGQGRLHVGWTVTGMDKGARLGVEWLEETITSRDGRNPSGFGSLMLEQLVASSVGGSSYYELGSESLTWRLDAPLSAVITPSQEAMAAAQRGSGI
jgi:PAS domain S-box-containing protein